MAERVAQGHYDDRVVEPGVTQDHPRERFRELPGEQSGVLVEAVIVELEIEPELGERLAAALAPFLAELADDGHPRVHPHEGREASPGSSEDSSPGTPEENDDEAPVLVDAIIEEVESEPELGERLAAALHPYLAERELELPSESDLLEAEADLHVGPSHRPGFLTGLMGGGSEGARQ